MNDSRNSNGTPWNCQAGGEDFSGGKGQMADSAPALGSYTPCFNTGFLTQLTTEAQAPPRWVLTPRVSTRGS